MVSLAVAMGLGRFAFTPLLPMMLEEGSIDLPAASWLASANYLAYMLGALLCTLQPLIWSRFAGLPAIAYSSIVRAGLAATALLTLAMAIHWPAAWPSLRFGAGIGTALVFVFTVGLCLARLARLGAPALGGIVFVGPGLGIVVSGLFGSAMVAWDWTAAAAWLVFGLLAVGLTLSVWRIFRGEGERLTGGQAPQPGVQAREAAASGRTQRGLFALGYGLEGFGYITTATFLPVIATEVVPGSVPADLFWPLFGCGAVAGSLLVTRLPEHSDRRYLMAVCHAIQAAGIMLGLFSPTLAAFAVGSFLVGLPFTAITLFAMQEARRLQGGTAAGFIGLLTVAYGLGQVVGPPLVALLLEHAGTRAAGFSLSLQIAAAGLLAGAAIYLWMIRAYPRSAAG
jgi:MFS family permease